MRGSRIRPAALLFLCASVSRLGAAGTAVWEMTTYRDFLAGVFSHVSLSKEGRLLLGPELKPLFASEQPLVWSMARAADGSTYLGTGHRGRVYRVDRNGAGVLFWSSSEPEVFALEWGPDGNLYAGTSPDGKVYRISPSGQAAVWFDPKSKYIWSLTFGRDGALFAGTGERGKIFRVDRSGRGELHYDTGQGHVTSLALDAAGALLAGTDPNGLLYRIEAKDRAFVLHDSILPEIRSLAVTPDGTIYAAAMGGAVSRLTQAGTPAVAGDTPAGMVVQSVTVTAGAEAQGGAQLPKPASETARSAPAVTATPPAPAVSFLGLQKSALLRIGRDLSVETLWTSTEENIYAVLPQAGGVLFSTDDHGRIYRLDPDRQVTLLAQTGEEETVRLAAVGTSLVAVTGNLGKLYRLGDGPAESGEYEAPVRDTGSVSRWGRVSWKAQTAAGASIEFSTRSGNSARPDSTWSEWSGPLRDGEGSPVASPVARFIQWRARLRGSRGSTPVVESVSLAYLPQNSAPVLRGITVGWAARSSTPPASSAPSAAGAADISITVTDTGAATSTVNPGTTTQTLSRPAAQPQLTSISWQAEDADGDKLIARVSFRGEGENEWKLLKENLSETHLGVDGDALADGVYQVKVQVSDSASNPRDTARETEMISAPFLVDNTPPSVRHSGGERSGAGAVVRFQAADAASMLRRAEYSLNAGPWIPVFSDDGIIDSKSETLTIRLEALKPGEHLITLRVADSAGNTGLGKAVLK